MRHGLVIAQVALCVTLLIGAGLLVRTFVNLVNVPTGIETRRVIAARMSLRDVQERSACARSTTARSPISARCLASKPPR